MKNVLKNFVHQLDTMNTISGGVTATAIKIDKNEDNITIKINAPTMSSQSFNVFVNGNHLVVYSILNDVNIIEDISDAEDAARHMVPVFNRTFDIPSIVDRSQIEASYQEGKLEVVMPYIADSNEMGIKRIDIREY